MVNLILSLTWNDLEVLYAMPVLNLLVEMEDDSYYTCGWCGSVDKYTDFGLVGRGFKTNSWRGICTFTQQR